MKAFAIKMGNDLAWLSNGAVNREFFVFAEDILGALVDAQEQADLVKEALLREGVPKDRVFIRIRSIEERCEVAGRTSTRLLIGCHSSEDQQVLTDYAKDLAQRILKDQGKL